MLSATSTMTWANLNIGIPALLVCVQMVPFSVLFHFAYTYRPYFLGNDLSPGSSVSAGDGRPHQRYQGGTLGLRALLELCNPSEIIVAAIFGFRMKAELQQLMLEGDSDIEATRLVQLQRNESG
jgi:hypothetical protein